MSIPFVSSKSSRFFNVLVAPEKPALSTLKSLPASTSNSKVRPSLSVPLNVSLSPIARFCASPAFSAMVYFCAAASPPPAGVYAPVADLPVASFLMVNFPALVIEPFSVIVNPPAPSFATANKSPNFIFVSSATVLSFCSKVALFSKASFRLLIVSFSVVPIWKSVPTVSFAVYFVPSAASISKESTSPFLMSMPEASFLANKFTNLWIASEVLSPAAGTDSFQVASATAFLSVAVTFTTVPTSVALLPSLFAVKVTFVPSTVTLKFCAMFVSVSSLFLMDSACFSMVSPLKSVP